MHKLKLYQCICVHYSLVVYALFINAPRQIILQNFYIKKQTEDIALLIIYFKVHRFSLFYNNALNIFRHVEGRTASPAPISTVQQKPPPPRLKLSTSITA